MNGKTLFRVDTMVEKPTTKIQDLLKMRLIFSFSIDLVFLHCGSSTNYIYVHTDTQVATMSCSPSSLYLPYRKDIQY